MYRLAVLELKILQDYLNRTVSSPHEYYLTSISNRKKYIFLHMHLESSNQLTFDMVANK